MGISYRKGGPKGGPRVVVSTAAFHDRFRVHFPISAV